MRRANLQAGLVGGAMTVGLSIIALLPYVGACIALPLFPLVYVLIGMIAVRVSDYPAGVSEASVGGAVAGAIAAIIGGLAAMFLAPIRLAIAGGPEELVLALPADTIQSLVQAGLDPVAVTEFVGGIGIGMLCCIAQLTTGVLLAAVGAGLYAAYRQT
ncbi:MAG: hypothetical protein U9R25_06820 [Chloroflexota bacterium]|nr:hypothetical protein [Chloroflexota bacterium]